jgi:Protein chain release factor A
LDKIFEQLETLLERYQELQELMSDPEVINDTKRYMAYSKEEADMREVVAAFKHYKELKKSISDSDEILRETDDPEMTAMAKEELESSRKELDEVEHNITLLMLPKDPNDDKNIIMEIRGAAGGDEASLFAADLLSMYSKYAEKQGWTFDIIDETDTEVGGYKDVAVMITGNSVYSKLKYENGATPCSKNSFY